MTKVSLKFLSIICLTLGISMTLSSAASAATPAACRYGNPQGGVTIFAMFTMRPYDYPIYRQAVTAEIPIMERNGMKFVRSYRVLAGKMGRYIDIWWAPSYKAFYKAFYNPSYVNPKFEAFLKKTTGALVSAHVDIVQLEKFPPCQ